MRPLLALLAAVAVLACVGCNPAYPPPADLPAEFTACDAPEDCTVVELGCCDACNGGEARAVATEHAATVAERYSEVCRPGTGCNLVGCPAWVLSCDAGVCGLERGEF